MTKTPLKCYLLVTTISGALNNAFERTGGHCGRTVRAMNRARGGAERAPRQAAQLGR